MRFIGCAITLMVPFCSVQAQQTAVFHAGDSLFSTVRYLNEVVVTAEKRELSPFDIPAALSVITTKSLPQENNLDLRNLSGIIPNFYMQEGGLKLSTPLYLRGIGTVSGTPPVGLYVDGVPVFDKNAFVFDLYDIRQIEVLRGPQTTLYGRNSITGLINIITNPPASGFSLEAKAGYGSFNSQTYQLVMNLPAGKLRNRLSGSYNRSDGYFRNRFTNNSKSNFSEAWNARYQGHIYADDNWKLMLGVNYNHSKDEGYAYHAIDSLKKDRYTVNFNSPASYGRDLLTADFQARRQFSQMNFNWITSYSYTKDNQLLDADFTYLDVFDNRKNSDQNLVTQEINLSSVSPRHHIEWTAGVFGFYKNLDNDYLATFGSDREKLLPLKVDQAFYLNNTLTWGLAGYGQIAVKDLLPGLAITAGIRYDYESVALRYRDSLLLTNTPAFIEFHRSDEDRRFKAWLPKFSLLRKWSDRMSVYATISKGYKAGGYNIIVNDMSSQMVELGYDEETLWNYEIGMKYLSSGKKFSFNASLYYIDWKDQQIFVMGMMGPGIKNAGDARSIGGEADMRWELLPHLTWSLSAGYSNARYYHNIEKEREGNRIVMAPDFTLNTGLMYGRKVNVSWFRQFTASTSVTGMGTQYFDEDNLLKQSPYFLWNTDLSISGRYLDFRVWGKNILDKAFFTYMLNNPIGKNMPEYFNCGQSGAPARFGASLSFRLN